jgi:GGDEF domain-containing protein
MDRLGASVGIALFPQDGTSADELLDSADHRLLAVKRERSREQRFRRAA